MRIINFSAVFGWYGSIGGYVWGFATSLTTFLLSRETGSDVGDFAFELAVLSCIASVLR